MAGRVTLELLKEGQYCHFKYFPDGAGGRSTSLTARAPSKGSLARVYRALDVFDGATRFMQRGE